MIEKKKPFLQTNETEKVSNKPLSDEELSSLIKAGNLSKFNEVELKVKKKDEYESFLKGYNLSKLIENKEPLSISE